MSAIDAYRHTCIGTVICLPDYPIESQKKEIALYRPDESTDKDEELFCGKLGGLVLGEGGGGPAAFCMNSCLLIQFSTSYPTYLNNGLDSRDVCRT